MQATATHHAKFVFPLPGFLAADWSKSLTFEPIRAQRAARDEFVMISTPLFSALVVMGLGGNYATGLIKTVKNFLD